MGVIFHCRFYPLLPPSLLYQFRHIKRILMKPGGGKRRIAKCLWERRKKKKGKRKEIRGGGRSLLFLLRSPIYCLFSSLTFSLIAIGRSRNLKSTTSESADTHIQYTNKIKIKTRVSLKTLFALVHRKPPVHLRT